MSKPIGSVRALLMSLVLLAGGFRGVAAQDGPPAIQPVDDGVLVDFQDADLRFVMTALAEAAGINLVYGDLPPTPVTLRMQRPVPRSDLVALLTSLAESYGFQVQDQGAFYRLQASDTRTTLEEADTTDLAGEDRRLFVYRLKHVPVGRLAAVLQSLFTGQALPASARRRPESLSDRNRDAAIPEVPVRPRDEPVQVELADVPQVGLPAQVQGDVQIVPDETSNALLIRATPADYRIVLQAVEQLDRRPLQVLIEVVIAEIRRNSDHGMSVSGSITSASATTTGSGTLAGETGGNIVLSLLRTGGIDIDAALSILSTRGDAQILSRPVLLAQNNQEARILIGSERPFVQVQRSLPTDGAARDQVIQYRDVGTKLTITPTINDDGYVNLNVLQEVSTATSETQFDAPVISTREASTALFIRDGQTAVIGGLIDHLEERSKSGIPLLMDIPLLGGLFGTTRKTNIDSELFLFITPHIVDTDDDMDRVRTQVQENSELLRQVIPDGPTTLVAPSEPGVASDSIGAQ